MNMIDTRCSLRAMGKLASRRQFIARRHFRWPRRPVIRNWIKLTVKINAYFPVLCLFALLIACPRIPSHRHAFCGSFFDHKAIANCSWGHFPNQFRPIALGDCESLPIITKINNKFVEDEAIEIASGQFPLHVATVMSIFGNRSNQFL